MRHVGATAASFLTAFALFACALVPARIARARPDAEPYLRVIVDSATVRAGPAQSFRRVYLAERGEVFRALSRATQGYWFRIELPDSTQGWIPGDAVHPHELGEDAAGGRWLSWLFAPPPLLGARGEVAITAGVLGGGGMLAARPTLLLEPAFGIELNGVVAVATAGRLWMLTAGPIVNIAPSWPIVPFATVQGGVTSSHPNADSFLLDSGTTATLSGGAGLRIGFHYRLTLRLEAREHVFFEPDRTVSQEEFSAGLTVMF